MDSSASSGEFLELRARVEAPVQRRAGPSEQFLTAGTAFEFAVALYPVGDLHRHHQQPPVVDAVAGGAADR